MSFNRLIAESAKYILGTSPVPKIEGSPKTIAALKEVLCASKELYCALCEGSELSEVMSLLDKKKVSAQRFKNITGMDWPL